VGQNHAPRCGIPFPSGSVDLRMVAQKWRNGAFSSEPCSRSSLCPFLELIFIMMGVQSKNCCDSGCEETSAQPTTAGFETCLHNPKKTEPFVKHETQQSGRAKSKVSAGPHGSGALPADATG